MIALRNVTKVYNRGGRPHRALDGVSLEIPKGTVFALLGPNGAGKTTLLSILATMVLPTAGEVRINGCDAVAQPRQVQKVLGLGLGGERSFYYRLSGRQNLEFFGALAGVSAGAIKQRVQFWAEKLDLLDALDAPYMKYSAGMKKKLGLMRALLSDAPVLLLDEPTAGVDAHSARAIRSIIKTLGADGRTVLVTTHDMREAEAISDVVGILNGGRLVAAQAAPDLRRAFGRPSLRVRVSEGGTEPGKVISLFQRLATHADHTTSWTVPIPDETFRVDEVVASLVQHNVAVVEVTTELPTLEDVFVALTQR